MSISLCYSNGKESKISTIQQMNMMLLSNYSKMSAANSNATIWFGHYPTSTIHSSAALRSTMR